MTNQMETGWVVIGVSGVTCGGKTTFAKALVEEFPSATVFHQDSYFLPVDHPRHTHIPSLNHINWEIESAIDMEKLNSEIKEVLRKPPPPERLPLLIIEGFLIFINQYISSICHHKVFFTLTRDECWARRCVRTYDPADVPGYFDSTVWPEYERHLQLSITINPDLKLIPGTKDVRTVVDEFSLILTRELGVKI